MIHNGDCLDVLPELESDSVDLMVTDPPYGISFMGKDWDRALPDKKIWQECLRVLKPGAFAFVMSIPRSDCQARMVIALQDAGFRVDFTPIYWAYASGFPKAQNIGKAVDKRNGRVADEYKALGNYLKIKRGTRPQKDIAQFFPSRTGGLTGCVANWELGLNVPTKEQWQILQQELNLDNRFDELIEREEAEREVVQERKQMVGGNGIYGEYKGDAPITLPATPQAKALDGSYGGFQPKPAVEVIIVAMKPLSEKTFVDQALKNGKGVTWLDDVRVPYESEEDKMPVHHGGSSGSGTYNWNTDSQIENSRNYSQPSGRFPANLIVSDDVLNDGKDTGAGITGSGKVGNQTGKYSWFSNNDFNKYSGQQFDSGSFSRYFDLDKWAQTLPFLIVPKASKSEKGKDCIHPTVKPLKLMSYLVMLGSREGDTVLDPFLGSGTTTLACQNLNRECIGIELDNTYHKIAVNRCTQKVMI